MIDDREKRSIILFSNECWRNSEVAVCSTKGNCKIRGANSIGNLVHLVSRPFNRSSGTLFSPSTNADCRSKPGNNRSTIDRPSAYAARTKVLLLVGHPWNRFGRPITDNLVSLDFSRRTSFPRLMDLFYLIFHSFVVALARSHILMI